MIFENYPANFYNFHYQSWINATTQINDHNEFDVKFIIPQLRKLKKLNYKLSILYKNKLYYTWDIIYKLEPTVQNLRSCYKLGVSDYDCGPPPWIISEQFIELIDGFIGLYSLDFFLYHTTFNCVCLQA